MPIDFRDYNDPGVYVEIIENPVTVSPGVEPTIVAFVGESPNSKQVTEYATIPVSGSKKLTEEGIKPETIITTDRSGTSSYISGLLGLLEAPATGLANQATEIPITATKYVSYLPAGDYAIKINGEDCTLVVSGTFSGGQTWKIKAVTEALVLPAGATINLNSSYESPSLYVGQTMDPSTSESYYDWEVSAADIALAPLEADKLCWVGIDREYNQSYTLTKHGSWTSGDNAETFLLKWDGSTSTVDLPYTATSDDIQTALEDIPAIGAGNVIVSPVNPSLVSDAPPALKDTAMNIRFVGKFLPSGLKANKDAVVTSVKSITSLTGAVGGTDHVPVVASVNTVGAESSISAGDILQVGGERMLVIKVGTAGQMNFTLPDLTSGTDEGGLAYLVQRGFQSTLVPSREPDLNTPVYKVDNDSANSNTLDADYTIQIDPGLDGDYSVAEDNRMIIGYLDDATQNIPRLQTGSKILVTAQVTDAKYYSPKHYTRDADVYDDYGNPFDSNSSTVNSDVSLAAQLAFANGANEIVIVAVNPNETNSESQNWKNAIDRLDIEPAVNTIVPLIDANDSPGTDIADYIQYKISQSYAEGVLRRAFFGFDSLLNGWGAADFEQAAKAYRDIRISLVAPGYALVANNTPTDSKVAGYFIAAAVAARQASLAPQEPLTRKQIYGFTAIQSLDFASLLDLQAAGVLVVWQDRLQRFIIKHGLTTDMTNSYTREISVVTARDRLRDLIFNTLDSGELIGSAMTSRTPDMVLAGVTSSLEEAMTLGLIFDYGDIQYRVNPIEPTAIEVRFAYKPSLPLNYIVVEFSIDTALGTLDFQTVNQSTTFTQ